MKPMDFKQIYNRLDIDTHDIEETTCEDCGEKAYKHTITYKNGRISERLEKPCACDLKRKAMQELQAKRLREYDTYSVMIDDYKNKMVRDYKPQNETQVRAREKVVEFLTHAKVAIEKGQGMVLSGTFGTGKTHLASAIRNALSKEGYKVLFITLPDYLEKIKKGYGKNGATDMRYIQESYKTQELAKSADLLVLDDVGANNMTAWAKEELFKLVNARTGKSTIVTSNYSLEAFSSDADLYRSFSRMSENSAVLFIKGDDMRRKGEFNYG